MTQYHVHEPQCYTDTYINAEGVANCLHSARLSRPKLDFRSPTAHEA